MSNPSDEQKKWFEAYVSKVNEGIILPPKAGKHYTCPCCGYPTLGERGAYDICGLCNWEDDGQDDPHADEVWGGPNGSYSLTEARENFTRHKIMYGPPKGDTRVGGSDSAKEAEAKIAIMHAFNALKSEKDAARIQALQRAIEHAQQTLSDEMQRRVNDHEKGDR